MNIKEKVKQNVEKGIVSNVIGSVIIIAAITSVFIPSLNISWGEAGSAITIGLAVIGLLNK